MELEDFTSKLSNAQSISAINAGNILNDESGMYAIFIDQYRNLSHSFATYHNDQMPNLIYIGKSNSLFKRIVNQDFRHQNPSTFFRAIGAILGYRPPRGSLCGKRNQNNYIFGPLDTQKIITWVNEHLHLRYIPMPLREATALEPSAIALIKPLLNTTHNPNALPELKTLRRECRKIATMIGV